MAKELTESRRTRYTRRAMQDALIELLRDQPLGSITVKALCERADVNRSTFYAHYASIEELLHDIEDETMAWVTTALEQLLAQPDPAGIGKGCGFPCRITTPSRKDYSNSIPAPLMKSKPQICRKYSPNMPYLLALPLKECYNTSCAKAENL